MVLGLLVYFLYFVDWDVETERAVRRSQVEDNTVATH